MKLSLTAFVLFLATAGMAITDAEVSRIATGIFWAEGGHRTKTPYGILSVKTRDPRRVCETTIRNSWGRWSAAKCPGEFLDFLGARYCPVPGDKTGLNKNWVRNVRARMPLRRRNFSIQ